MTNFKNYFILDPLFSNPKRIRSEREKARKIKKSQWWFNLLQRGLCHYCEKKFTSKELTMDHVVPLARGGKSTRSNLVTSCKPCNQNKKLLIPAESLIPE
jgi:5-methylcytosine-specific restriction enzyme A